MQIRFEFFSFSIYNINMRCLIVEKKYDKKKLNIILFDMFPALTSSTFYKALRKKDIRINKIRIKDNVLIHEGDEIQLFISDDLLFPSVSDILFPVYEDSNLVVFNKPAFLEVTGEYSLTSIAKKYYLDKGSTFLEPCHRLDRNTTGLVIFAKNPETLAFFLAKIKEREIKKYYLCLVYGIPSPSSKTLKSYLFKDTKRSLVYISDCPKKGYLPIITSYSILKKNKEQNYSLLEIELHTGRTHQIRAHLAHIRHPILGDGKYGINQVNKKFGFKIQQLCAYKLQFSFLDCPSHFEYLKDKLIQISSPW